MSAFKKKQVNCLICLGLSLPLAAHTQWAKLSIVDTTTPNLRGQRNQATDVGPDGTLGVAWVEETSDRKNPIVFVKSTDRGNSFQKYIVIDSVLRTRTPTSPGEGRSFHDFKFGPDGTVWVLWSYFVEYDFFVQSYLRLSKSTDGGGTFSQVFHAPRASATFIPRLAITHEGTVFVLWDDQQFKCTRFLHGNVNNRRDAAINTNPYTIDQTADLVVDSAFNVYCSWNGYTFDSTSTLRAYVFCSVSRDSGKSFLPFVNVSPDTVNNWAPRIAVTNSNIVFVIYRSYVGQHQSGSTINDVSITKSEDGGNTFGGVLTLKESIIGGGIYPNVIYQPTAGVIASWTFTKWLGDFTFASDVHVSRSVDLGVTFSEPTSIGSEIFSSVLSADTLGNVFLFAGGVFKPTIGNAVYFSNMNVLTSVEDNHSNNLAERFALHQNYPNPFNSSTLIKYEVPQRGLIDISVFDLVGRLVATLANQIEDPGTRMIKFEATGLPSGIYFYRFLSGPFVETKKMIVLR